MMRIMTSNIWGDYFRNPVEIRIDGISVLIERYLPDILGLQEVTPGWYNSDLFKRLSLHYNVVEYGLGNYTPLLYNKHKYDLKERGWELYQDTPDNSKSLTWAVLTDKETGNTFGVCNTHFWWKARGQEDDLIRVENAKQLFNRMKLIREKYDIIVFAFGDLNCHGDSPAIKYLREQGAAITYDMTMVRSEVSSHHGDPVLGDDGKYHGQKTENPWVKSLDHIIVYGKDYEIKRYQVVEDQYILDATDHSPVYIDVNDLRK